MSRKKMKLSTKLLFFLIFISANTGVHYYNRYKIRVEYLNSDKTSNSFKTKAVTLADFESIEDLFNFLFWKKSTFNIYEEKGSKPIKKYLATLNKPYTDQDLQGINKVFLKNNSAYVFKKSNGYYGFTRVWDQYKFPKYSRVANYLGFSIRGHSCYLIEQGRMVSETGKGWRARQDIKFRSKKEESYDLLYQSNLNPFLDSLYGVNKTFLKENNTKHFYQKFHRYIKLEMILKFTEPELLLDRVLDWCTIEKFGNISYKKYGTNLPSPILLQVIEILKIVDRDRVSNLDELIQGVYQIDIIELKSTLHAKMAVMLCADLINEFVCSSDIENYLSEGVSDEAFINYIIQAIAEGIGLHSDKLLFDTNDCYNGVTNKEVLIMIE